MTDATQIRKAIETGDEGMPPAASPQTTRRRLMLGAAAALPSVYTLSSGAQTAVASNLRCWDKGRGGDSRDFRDYDPPEHPPRLTMTHDEWLRKEVYYGVCDGRPAYCMNSEQSTCIDPMNASQGRVGSYWFVDGDRIVVGPKASVTQVSSAARGYGLVYVDQQGTIATLDPEPYQHVHPVKETCWTSILGGRGSTLG